MERTLTTTHLLSYSECDLTGHWKPSAIMQAAQDISVSHADLLGCGNEVLEEKGLVWLVSRQQYHFDRYPKAGETVRLTTWPGEPRRILYPRYHIFETETGERLGCASTIWMLADRESKKLLSVQKTGVTMPETADLIPPMSVPEKVVMPEGESSFTERQVCYSDADINHHMNNTRYLEWACDLLDPNRFLTDALGDFAINYLHEAKLSMTLRMCKIEKEDAFYLLGTDVLSGRDIFSVHGCWRSR